MNPSASGPEVNPDSNSLTITVRANDAGVKFEQVRRIIGLSFERPYLIKGLNIMIAKILWILKSEICGFEIQNPQFQNLQKLHQNPWILPKSAFLSEISTGKHLWPNERPLA